MEADGVEYTGKTVGDAIAEAEQALSLTRDELDIEIVTPGRSGVFGIGAENARIRARPKGQEIPQPAAEPDVPVATHEPDVEETAPASVARSDSTAASEDAEPPKVDPELASEASTVLHELLGAMGIEAAVSVRTDEVPVTLAINGENLGVLIGRRGDNLAALQFMVNLILAKNRRQWPRVVIDVENYRARREESLRSLADRIAYRVRRNGQAYTLEAMPASDRRIIHLSLRDRNDLETYSIGEGPSRRVVIAPKRSAHVPASDRYSRVPPN